MHISSLGLNYLVGPGIKHRSVHVQPPKANAHRVKTPGQGVQCGLNGDNVEVQTLSGLAHVFGHLLLSQMIDTSSL